MHCATYDESLLDLLELVGGVDLVGEDGAHGLVRLVHQLDQLAGPAVVHVLRVVVQTGSKECKKALFLQISPLTFAKISHSNEPVPSLDEGVVLLPERHLGCFVGGSGASCTPVAETSSPQFRGCCLFFAAAFCSFRRGGVTASAAAASSSGLAERPQPTPDHKAE